jgi:hypothetical protein
VALDSGPVALVVRILGQAAYSRYIYLPWTVYSSPSYARQLAANRACTKTWREHGVERNDYDVRFSLVQGAEGESVVLRRQSLGEIWNGDTDTLST